MTCYSAQICRPLNNETICSPKIVVAIFQVSKKETSGIFLAPSRLDEVDEKVNSHPTFVDYGKEKAGFGLGGSRNHFCLRIFPK
jgi:hypothetical protein